jgi:hypothetical protein
MPLTKPLNIIRVLISRHYPSFDFFEQREADCYSTLAFDKAWGANSERIAVMSGLSFDCHRTTL